MSHKRIKLTHTPRWAKGMCKIAPGFYATAAGERQIHISRSARIPG